MAQKTAAQILSEITTLLADNTSGAISAEDVRSVLTDINDSFPNLLDASVSATEFGYLDGVTSALQTQLDAKADVSGETFTGTVEVSNAVPIFKLNDTSASVDEKITEIRSNNGTIRIQHLSDAGSGGGDYAEFTRSGNNMTSLTLYDDAVARITLNNAGTADFNGKVDVGSMQFSGGTGDQGTVSWNTDDETLDLIVNGTTMQLGQDLEYNVRNTSGGTLAYGTPVMKTGTIGNSGRITVSEFDPSNPANAKDFLGFLHEELENNGDGKACYFGKLRGINTTGSVFTQTSETWSDGDQLWLDSTNAGKLTNVKPTSGIKIPAAIVINAAANGSLFVKAIEGSNLQTTNDVNLTSVSSGEILTYDGSFWINQTTTEAGILKNVVEDTTPQLGGNLDANSKSILNVSQIDSNSIVKNSQTLSITTGAATFISGLGNFATITLTENTTIGFEITGGEELILEVTQDGTGSRTLTFSDVLWAGGSPPTVTQAAGSVDVFRFITINETIYGSIIGQNFS